METFKKNLAASLELHMDSSTEKIENNSLSINLLNQSITNIKNEIRGEIIKETIKALYDNGLFSLYSNADELLKDYLEFHDRRRPAIN